MSRPLRLLLLRPFEIRDRIVVGDLEGSVERIALRATRLRAYDGRVLLVPNAEVFTSRIINSTADPIRRADYKNTASAVREAVVAAFRKAGIGLPEPDVRLLRPQQVETWREALGSNSPA